MPSTTDQRNVADLKQRAPWRQHLVDAESGLKQGLRNDSTLAFYFFSFTVAVAAGIVAGLTAGEWAVVTLALSSVLSAEMLRQMAQVFSQHAGESMRSAAGQLQRFSAAAVAISCIGAVVTTILLLIHRIHESWPA